MKSICLLSRRPGSTREAFRDYYENRHSRLGSRYFPFRKYVRNHVLESSAELDFDVLTEFFFGDDPGAASLMAGPVGVIMSLDERNFMDQSLIRPAASAETLVAGPERDVAPPGTRRQMLLIDAADGAQAGFAAGVRGWGTALAADASVARVTLDEPYPEWGGRPTRFPYAAVLSLWLRGGSAVALPAAPAGLSLRASLLADVCESTPELLASLYGH